MGPTSTPVILSYGKIYLFIFQTSKRITSLGRGGNKFRIRILDDLMNLNDKWILTKDNTRE